MQTKYNFRFISDSGHGWLEVPIGLLLTIGTKPSQCSYVNHKTGKVYLEEDCDAPRFILDIKQKGIEHTIAEFYCNGEASLRRLPRYGAL